MAEFDISILLLQSTMVKRGQRGDAVLLRPTVMFCVPLILDRVYKVGKRLTATIT